MYINKYIISIQTFSFFSDFFSHLLNVIEKGSKLNKKVSTLIYLRALCKWLELPVKDARKIDFVKNKFDLTDEVSSYLVENYTVASQTGR